MTSIFRFLVLASPGVGSHGHRPKHWRDGADRHKYRARREISPAKHQEEFSAAPGLRAESKYRGKATIGPANRWPRAPRFFQTAAERFTRVRCVFASGVRNAETNAFGFKVHSDRESQIKCEVSRLRTRPHWRRHQLSEIRSAFRELDGRKPFAAAMKPAHIAGTKNNYVFRNWRKETRTSCSDGIATEDFPVICSSH